MNIAKRIVILAGAVGLFFYTAEQEELITLIANFNLSWYKLGVPVAWGLVIGGLCALLKFRWLLSWMAPFTLVASAITTMGLTGAAAVFVKHQLVVLCLPPLQLAAVGVGLYLFAVGLAKLMGDIEARKSEKGEE